MRGLVPVPATSPCNRVPWRVRTKGLVAGTCPINSSHKAFWGTSNWDLSQKFKLVWIHGTSLRDQSWSLHLDFEAKRDSSHNGTCSCNLLHGLVPWCVSTLSLTRTLDIYHIWLGKEPNITCFYELINLCQGVIY